jgi:hypothetical protein
MCAGKILVLRVTSKDLNVHPLLNLNLNVVQGDYFAGISLKDNVLSLKLQHLILRSSEVHHIKCKLFCRF